MAYKKRPATIHDPRYKRIVNLLIEARKSAGLTQVQLAEKIGLPQPDISKIERCERRIDALELVDWCKVTKQSFAAIERQ
jgi:transcriptional regulator with XRE-family HTH domain